VVTSPGPGEVEVYRPISGLAIAGLGFSIAYTALVVISALVALIQGAPLFLAGWMVFLAVLGACLSAGAIWRIRSSEGTRAGLKVAQWGLWLSIISGLGYTAYTSATAAAVKEQAKQFLTREDGGFFALMEKGELNAAFLLTKPFSQRTGVDPRNDEVMRRQFDSPLGQNPIGYLSKFESDNFVHVLQEGYKEKGAVTIEPLGVKEWSYAATGYKVVCRYRVTTPETTMEVQMTVQSTEHDSAGEGRKWFINWLESGWTTIEFTPAGNRMRELRNQSLTFADTWLKYLSRGQRGKAFLDTLDPQAGEAAARRLVALTSLQRAFPAPAAGPFAAGTLGLFAPDGEVAKFLYLPGYDRFIAGSFLKTEDARAMPGLPLKQAIADLKQALLGEQIATLPNVFRTGHRAGVGREDDTKYMLWDLVDGKELRIAHVFQVNLVEDVPGQGYYRFQGRGRLVVATPVPGDPRTTPFTPQWRILEVALDRVVPLPKGR
jgi:hypothetical protein